MSWKIDGEVPEIEESKWKSEDTFIVILENGVRAVANFGKGYRNEVGELIVGVGMQASWFINNFTEIVQPITWVNINDLSQMDDATEYTQGMLSGIKYCKEMFEAGKLTLEVFKENETYWEELLEEQKNYYNTFEK